MEIISIPGFSEPFSSISHLIGAACFFIASFFLIKEGRGNKTRTVSFVLYSLSLVFLFSMSGVYHLLEPSNTPRYVLRHLDYAGIWILIAGSFIPLHMILFRGIKRWGVLAPVWIIAITGLTLQMVFFDSIPHWLSLTFFLCLGWMGCLTMWLLRTQYPDFNFKYMAIGGVSYSFGAILDFLNWPIIIEGVLGPHGLFHIFVLIGAASHWYFIFVNAHFPSTDKLRVRVSKNLTNNNFELSGLNEKFSFNVTSVEEGRMQIASWISKNYHQKMYPSEVHYFYEEKESYKIPE